MRKSRNKPRTKRLARSQSNRQEPPKLPFIAHIRELRRRIFIMALAVGGGAGIALIIQEQLTAILLKPAGDQQFIYTTPGGGFDFQFKLCLYTGIALSVPVIIYHIFRYIHPLLGNQTRRFMGGITVSSSILALAGIAFGYFVGLPAAMHFLLQSLSSERIEALITIQSYMSFVMIYLLGAALLFQIPLILILINRIKPLNPRKLLLNQRWPILGAVVAGAVISPTPDIRNQLILSGPIILMYELSVMMIWMLNRKHRRPKKAVELLKKDAEIQADRLAQFAKVRTRQQSVSASNTPVALPEATVHTAVQNVQSTTPQKATQTASRPGIIERPSRRYVQDFRRGSYSINRPGTASDATSSA